MAVSARGDFVEGVVFGLLGHEVEPIYMAIILGSDVDGLNFDLRV